MIKSRFFAIILITALFFSMAGSLSPANAQPLPLPAPDFSKQASNPGDFVPGELVVVMDRGDKISAYSANAFAAAKTVGASIKKIAPQGSLLLKLPANADLASAAANLKGKPGVIAVEPNYIYRIPAMDPKYSAKNYNVQRDFAIRKAPKNDPQGQFQGKKLLATPIKNLQAMKTKVKNKIQAVYPNDKYLWWNGGWSWVGADIVSSNTTASAQICEIDTGVDYAHPDLAANIIKGWDFVNNDADPMDDMGHGTHVAGIMAAVKNNGIGIAGVSSGKVMAVKALDAQGSGTNFDIANAITYCANQAANKVITMSLGGGYPSTLMEIAIDYAVNTKGKLITAAAGNSGMDSPNYPAFYSNQDQSGSADCSPACNTYPALAGKVLAVGAEGQIWTDADNYSYVDYSCMASYSSFGSWVNVVAPGTWIYSTTPYDKPFYMNYWEGTYTRYDSMSGTSMATPFVAAAAARRWGYTPSTSNVNVGKLVSVWPVYDYLGDGSCWPANMDGVTYDTNVAKLLDKGGLYGAAADSNTGLPLDGATIGVYNGAALIGSAIISPSTYTVPQHLDPARVFTDYTMYTDVINLPVGSKYTPKVSKAGYAAVPQPAFQQNYPIGAMNIWGGSWTYAGVAGVPPLSANFTNSSGWLWFYDDRWGSKFDYAMKDLDLNIWLPDASLPGTDQPNMFIVGWEGNSFGANEDDPTGALGAFPYARMLRDGGYLDALRIETILVQNRSTQRGLTKSNPALPWYYGTYTAMMTDYGQSFGINLDGCGDNFGIGFDPYYEIGSDSRCIDTDELNTYPLLGTVLVPYLYVWKDGIIKNFNSLPFGDPGSECNSHWWKATTISSSAAAAVPTISNPNTCGDAYPGIGPGDGGGIQPYGTGADHFTKKVK